MRHFLLVLLGAALAAGCGEAPTCRTNADCAAGMSCAGSGGVFFGSRVCVLEHPFGDVDLPDVGPSDTSGGTDAPVDPRDRDDVSSSDGSLPDSDDVGSDPDACAPEPDTEFCARLGADCGRVTGTDRCGQTRTVDCRRCSCDAGFEFSEAVGGCVDIDECARGTHDCAAMGGICSNTAGSWQCSCDAGYSGDGRACWKPPALDPAHVWRDSSTNGLLVFPNVPAIPNAVYLLAIVTSDMGVVTSVQGLGVNWTLLREQCGEETGDVELWATASAAAASTDVAITAGVEEDFAAVLTAWTHAAVSPASVTGYNVAGANGPCVTGAGSDVDVSFPTTNADSAIVMASGVVRSQFWRNSGQEIAGASVISGDNRDLQVYQTAWGPPVQTPAHAIGGRWENDDFAAVVVELLPAVVP